MATISIRMNDTLKANLQELTNELGMDITTFFTMAATQAVREHGLPFTPNTQPFNYETLQAKWEIDFMRSHPELPWKTYDNADDLFDDLLGDDEDEV